MSETNVQDGPGPQGTQTTPSGTPSDPPKPQDQQPAPTPAKPTEPTKPPPEAAPLTVEALKLPEGVEVKPDDPRLKSFLEVMNDAKLSPADRANKLIELQHSVTREVAEGLSKQWSDMQEQWQGEVKADPVLGQDASLGAVRKVVEEFFPPEAKQIFDTTGAGNNIHIIRGLYKISQVLSEGKLMPAGQPQAEQKDAASLFYPTMNKE